MASRVQRSKVCTAVGSGSAAIISAVIGEVVKGRGGGELLSLEEHGGGGGEEQIGGEGTIAPRARELMKTAAMGGVGDLVVVLEEAHERLGRQVESRGATAPALPPVALP